MKKILSFIIALAALSACQEWDPVLIRDYGVPEDREPMMATVNTTIAQLKQMYVEAGHAVEIGAGVVIGGQVISSDRSGNLYRELYIQDATGAICVKVGKSSMYSDYHLGQWLYIDCAGLVIGAYRSMPQLGIEDESGEYDTAYIDAQYLIDTHIFKGRVAEMPQPRSVTAAEISQAVKDGGFKSDLWGAYVKLPGVTYGSKIFAILYAGDGNENRIFLRDGNYGVTTWAMTKAKLLENIAAGNFAGTSTQGGRKLEGEVLDALVENASPVTMSQYFSLAGVDVQVRTSGYAKFADTEIPAAVIEGAPADLTGILTIYDSDAQFTLIDLDGVSVQ